MKLEISEKILVDTLVGESLQKKIITGDKYKIIKLTGDASTRRYYRVVFDEKGYVVCLDMPRNPDDGEPDFLRIQKVLKLGGVRVPQILDIDIERGYYLEEDLGDQTFLRQLSLCKSREEERQLYIEAVDLLISLHKTNLKDYPNEIFNKRSFDEEKLMQEIHFTFQQFIEGLMGYQRDQYNYNLMVKDFSSLAKRICRGPWVFTHRDYHSRNLMFKEGELIVIDFQDARRGLPQYDLSSLLEDCYYQITSENHDFLIERYWQSIGRDLYKTKEEFMNSYNLVAIQRIFKAIGSFAYIYRLRGDIRYLRHIGRAFERLKDIMFASNEYPQLRQELSSLYYAY